MKLHPIGTIHTPFTEQRGTPIQAAVADGAQGTVEVLPRYAEALADIDGFDRIWLIYAFRPAKLVKYRVLPYLDTQTRGLFATRAPRRPNPIGMSCVRLLAVEGTTLRVADIDVLDGTPLLDIKPYAPRFDHFEVERCGWLDKVGSGRTRADDRFEQG